MNCNVQFHPLFTKRKDLRNGLKNPRKERIIPFLDWWDKRRSRWKRAFKNNDVESRSLSESVNSMMGRENKPLHDCLQFEICNYMKHHSKTETLTNTSFSGGRGPNRKY